MNTILAFDIETVPDVQGIRTLYELPSSLPDDEVVLFAQQNAVLRRVGILCSIIFIRLWRFRAACVGAG